MKNPRIFGLALTLMGALSFASTASAYVVDGFDVTFNAFPTSDITSGLTPTSVVVAGASVTPLPPAGGYFRTSLDGGIGGFIEGTGDNWGATNPFTQSSANGGPEYAGIWNGTATYTYSAPQDALSILWGSVGNDDLLTFYGKTGNSYTSLGSINGIDLRIAAGNDVPGFVYPDGVDLTVSVPSGFYEVSLFEDTQTFEYGNFVSVAVPEPSHYGFVVFLAVAGFFGWKRFSSRPALTD